MPYIYVSLSVIGDYGRQNVNTYVFKNPAIVMANIDKVTEHNLVRTRNQIALAKDMQEKMPEMERIVKECIKTVCL